MGPPVRTVKRSTFCGSACASQSLSLTSTWSTQNQVLNTCFPKFKSEEHTINTESSSEHMCFLKLSLRSTWSTQNQVLNTCPSQNLSLRSTWSTQNQVQKHMCFPKFKSEEDMINQESSSETHILLPRICFDPLMSLDKPSFDRTCAWPSELNFSFVHFGV